MSQRTHKISILTIRKNITAKFQPRVQLVPPYTNGPLEYLFTARRSYASAVLGVVILSVCPSVCPPITRELCDKSKEPTGDILYHMKVSE